MKPRAAFFILIFSLTGVLSSSAVADKPRPTDMIILDATGVQNLRIQTAPVEETDFEETIFALGTIEVYPGRRAVVSSRIAGRAREVLVKPDHAVEKDSVVVVVESRQIGDPPPSIALTAPISGMISTLSVVPGEPVSPEEILAEIVDLSEVYAVANVPQHLAGRLKSGQRARIKAATGDSFQATLEHIGTLADAASGTLEAAFRVENPARLLRPGMRAEFSIVTDQRANVMSVPRSALQGDPSKRFVYVKDFELPNAFIKSPVVVGQMNDRVAEVISGLFPADEVVTQGAYSLGFVGGGSLSLKEALDAAHGHEHAADGSELTDEAKKKTGAASASGADHGHGHDHAHGHGDEHEHESPLWMIVSGVLFVALLVVSFRKRGPVAKATEGKS
jgi:membrane fusion protein, heavy metal efflux system